MEYVMFQQTGAVNAITSKRNTGRSVEFKEEQNTIIYHYSVLNIPLLQPPLGFSPSQGLFKYSP